MKNFSYVAKLSDGRTRLGQVEANSETAVLDALHRQGLVVIKIKEAIPKVRGRWGSVQMDDLALFSRQLATLVDAGIPIVSGLESLADQLENQMLQKVVFQVKGAVESGTNLTAAIAKHSDIFSPLFISMIRAGEASGHLAEVLSRLATYLEKTAALQRKIKAACVYPAIVTMMAIFITGLLILKVIPAFKDIFKTLGAQLPLPTRILLAISDLAVHGFVPLLLSFFVGVFLFRRLLRTPKGRLLFDRFLLKIKLVGPIVRKVAIARFSRTLATLTKSGVPILSALDIVSASAGNQVVAQAVLQVRNSIREGESIAVPLSASGVFPPLVVRMIAVGEESGRLEEMLAKVAEFYEEQVESAISGLTSAIEPLIIAVLGVVIGSIVLSIFMPIFRITQLLTR